MDDAQHLILQVADLGVNQRPPDQPTHGMGHDDHLMTFVTRPVQLVDDLVDALGDELCAFAIRLQPVIAKGVHRKPAAGSHLLELILGHGLLR